MRDMQWTSRLQPCHVLHFIGENGLDIMPKKIILCVDCSVYESN